MHITIDTILTQLKYNNAYLLAGENGLNKYVKRISVFDCPVKGSILDKNIIEAGDLFLSGLSQFMQKKDLIISFISTLNETKCSGLCITDENLQLMTPKVIEYCNNNGFPVLVFDKNISYAAIMNIINKLLILEHKHMANFYILEKILTREISKQCKLDLLSEINPLFMKTMQVFAIKGEYSSSISQNDMDRYFLTKKTDTFIKGDNNISYFLFSDDNSYKLSKRLLAFRHISNNYFISTASGSSSISEIQHIDKMLKEARNSLHISEILNSDYVEYDATSTTQLIMLFRQNDEIYDFYYSVLKKLSDNDPENSLDLLNTLCLLVNNKGSYHDVAIQTNQHQNTVRYRINKVRQILDMSDDIIKFHETISIFSKIHTVVCSSKIKAIQLK